jgi:hypothetical protein
MSDPTLRQYYQRLSGNLMYSSQALESHVRIPTLNFLFANGLEPESQCA